MKIVIEVNERGTPNTDVKTYSYSRHETPAIPHEGDNIVIDGISHSVKTVFIDYDTNTVTVRCR